MRVDEVLQKLGAARANPRELVNLRYFGNFILAEVRGSAAERTAAANWVDELWEQLADGGAVAARISAEVDPALDVRARAPSQQTTNSAAVCSARANSGTIGD